jgi:hypothetical protein
MIEIGVKQEANQILPSACSADQKQKVNETAKGKSFLPPVS